MAQSSGLIVSEVHDAILVLRFNQPLQRNPLSLPTLRDLKTSLSASAGRDDVKAIIFTGTDDVFASGANIRELATLDSFSALVFSKLGQQVFQTIADSHKLTIAAINGFCMGGALDLALACDIRVASRDAIFAHPGASLGLITGWGGTQRLPQLIGRARSLELFTSARRIGSEEALSIGLVTKVEDPVLPCAFAACRKVTSITGGSPSLPNP